MQRIINGAILSHEEIDMIGCVLFIAKEKIEQGNIETGLDGLNKVLNMLAALMPADDNGKILQ